MTDASPAPRWPGSVALVLASSTGGVGQHVRSITRGLTEAGASVLVCGPSATEEQFDFTGAGARFTPAPLSPPTWACGSSSCAGRATPPPTSAPPARN
ncbi:glycosyltransferase [Micromonospora tulbaghiae]